jgi:hypothetical protein
VPIARAARLIKDSTTVPKYQAVTIDPLPFDEILEFEKGRSNSVRLSSP